MSKIARSVFARLDRIEQSLRAVWNMTASGGLYLSKNDAGWSISGGVDADGSISGPWRLTALNTTTKVATIAGGYVNHLTRTAILLGATNVTVGSATNEWAYIEYSDGSASIKNTTTNTYPESDSNTYRVAIQHFQQDGGDPVHYEQRRFSDVEVPSVYP